MPKYIVKVGFITKELRKTRDIPNLKEEFNKMCNMLSKEVRELRSVMFRESDQLYYNWENLNPVCLTGYAIFSIVRPTIATGKMGLGKAMKKVFLSGNAFFSRFKPDWDSFLEIDADKILGFAIPW